MKTIYVGTAIEFARKRKLQRRIEQAIVFICGVSFIIVMQKLFFGWWF